MCPPRPAVGASNYDAGSAFFVGLDAAGKGQFSPPGSFVLVHLDCALLSRSSSPPTDSSSPTLVQTRFGVLHRRAARGKSRALLVTNPRGTSGAEDGSIRLVGRGGSR